LQDVFDVSCCLSDVNFSKKKYLSYMAFFDSQRLWERDGCWRERHPVERTRHRNNYKRMKPRPNCWNRPSSG